MHFWFIRSRRDSLVRLCRCTAHVASVPCTVAENSDETPVSTTLLKMFTKFVVILFINSLLIDAVFFFGSKQRWTWCKRLFSDIWFWKGSLLSMQRMTEIHHMYVRVHGVPSLFGALRLWIIIVRWRAAVLFFCVCSDSDLNYWLPYGNVRACCWITEIACRKSATRFLTRKQKNNSSYYLCFLFDWKCSLAFPMTQS